MANKRWFTMKHHGWGWVPITWEGWAVTLGLMAYIISISFGLEKNVVVPSEYWIQLLIGLAVFFFIAFKKGPVPKWRWDKR